MKILFAIGIITFATSALCTEFDEVILPTQAGGAFNYADRERDLPPPTTPDPAQPAPDAGNTTAGTPTAAADPNAAPRNQQEFDSRANRFLRAARGSKAEKCADVIDLVATVQNPQPDPPAAPGAAALPPRTPINPFANNNVKTCLDLQRLSGGTLQAVNSRENSKQSLDGQIRCVMKASYTIDYEACEKATQMYDAVRVAEKAMDMQQTLRTEAKNRNIQAETAARAAEGDLQAGALDAGIAQHRHMKAMNTEKMMAYSASVMALVNALRQIPGEGQAKQQCANGAPADQQDCQNTVKNNKGEILANQSAKAALATAIAEFTAKGLAAGIAMGNNQKAADTIAKAKTPFEDEPQDLMLERCQFNPADPACITAGERVSGGGIGRGEFGFGDGGNNAFNLNPESGEFGEVGAETTLDDGNEISSLNNPFSDDAKRANDILNPAAAAQVQASGGAGGGSGGGAGGGLGGGGASLGSDLAGADKDGDKEAQIKTGKVSGAYGAVGGGGYRGIARSKENANPFASLFDKKGAAGGAVVDGSIPADIDGKASGLFQKISKRYTRIHADKRIEARNLE